MTPLQLTQQSQRATFNDSGLALDFGDVAGEMNAARNQAALFDLGSRTQIELTGSDRQKFLHNFCTNEVCGLQAGQGCEAFLTTIQGKIKAHLFIFAEANSLWIDTTAGYEDKIVGHLDKYQITEDVQFHRRSAEYLDFYISGPEVLSQLTALGLPMERLTRNQHVRLSFAGQEISVRRVDWLGLTGCLIQVEVGEAATVWKALTTGGFTPAGQAAFEALRIAACFPIHGFDLTEDNLAQEAARTPLAISFSKGCYLGQEPIARIDSMGHVNQELRGLRFESGPLPALGATVVLPGEVREAGIVTSVAWDAIDKVPLALAMLKRNYMSPGTKLNVAVGDVQVSATVFGRA